MTVTPDDHVTAADCSAVSGIGRNGSTTAWRTAGPRLCGRTVRAESHLCGVAVHKCDGGVSVAFRRSLDLGCSWRPCEAGHLCWYWSNGTV